MGKSFFLLPSLRSRRSLNKLAVIGALSEKERAVLFPRNSEYPSKERVSIMLSHVYKMCLSSLCSGKLRSPPPVFSRLLQVLSDGALSFHSARKIRDTPFPFPYAQTIALLVWSFVATAPIVFAAFMQGVALVAVSVFLCTWAYLALNQTARELEDPFGGETNNLPLSYYQWCFNRRINAVNISDEIGSGWMELGTHSSPTTGKSGEQFV